MTTVVEIVNLALKDATVIGESDPASAETMQDAITTLNQMLGLWQLDNIHVYAEQETSFAATGASTYTVGTGGAVNTIRPVKIEAAFWRDNGIDYPIEVLNTFTEFENIPLKTQPGEPCALYYRPTVPLGTIHIYPQPTSGNVHIITLIDMPEYASQAADLALPRSYELAVRSNLAVLLAATFHTPLRPDIIGIARMSRDMMKRANVRIPEAKMPASVVQHRGDIFRGY